MLSLARKGIILTISQLLEILIISRSRKTLTFNLFHFTDLFLYLLKTSQNQRFSDILGFIESDQWDEMGQETNAQV